MSTFSYLLPWSLVRPGLPLLLKFTVHQMPLLPSFAASSDNTQVPLKPISFSYPSALHALPLGIKRSFQCSINGILIALSSYH